MSPIVFWLGVAAKKLSSNKSTLVLEDREQAPKNGNDDISNKTIERNVNIDPSLFKKIHPLLLDSKNSLK
jgi:hypothetical protein